MERKLPSYPLFLKDPNFSLWSSTDELNSSFPIAWWGETKPIYGFVRTEEGVFCFLGDAEKVLTLGVKKAKQTNIEVTSFTTDYIFDIGKGKLKISFVSPLSPDDIDLISMPVCYMNYEVSGVKRFEISLFLNRRICYNDFVDTQEKQVRGGVVKLEQYETAFFGLKRQKYLSNNDDGAGADWGYFYLAGQESFFTDDSGLSAYLSSGDKTFPFIDDNAWLVALQTDKSGRIIIAYDDIMAIDYFGSIRKTAYLEKYTIFQAIENAFLQADDIDKRLSSFDANLKQCAKKISDDYYAILVASLRQSIAAHKLVYDEDGNILFLSKENHSNGCIATVDVSYPSMPVFLLYNPELVKGMMRPILKFARMPVWNFDFAPHDAGTYPACCGQVYALKQNNDKYHARYKKDGEMQTHFPIYTLPPSFNPYDLHFQMPVEECANMLIMFAACYKRDGDISFFTENADLCRKWVKYLEKYGLRPEEQLCTDDFAGHLKNNLNLSIKATVGIGAYALLEKGAGDDFVGFSKKAHEYADKITQFCYSFEHSPLTWDSGEDTFSLKYNLAFDKILGLNLFPDKLFERETDFYLNHINKFGIPLDSRKNYTKSDWICWTASLTDDKEKATAIIKPLVEFLRHSPERMPFTDWFDTEDGTKCGFTARSVQGGCFILLMKEL